MNLIRYILLFPFLSGQFTALAIMNPQDGKLVNSSSVHCVMHAHQEAGNGRSFLFTWSSGAPRQRGSARHYTAAAAAGSLQACGREWAMTGVSDWELRGCRPSNLARLQNGIRKRHRIIAVFTDYGHTMRAFLNIPYILADLSFEVF